LHNFTFIKEIHINMMVTKNATETEEIVFNFNGPEDDSDDIFDDDDFDIDDIDSIGEYDDLDDNEDDI